MPRGAGPSPEKDGESEGPVPRGEASHQVQGHTVEPVVGQIHGMGGLTHPDRYRYPAQEPM